MQADQAKQQIIHQINEFLTYTADTDNDTISAQYTIIQELDHQLKLLAPAAGHTHDSRADVDYFLTLNTMNPQPPERKPYALEGLQERARQLLKRVQE